MLAYANSQPQYEVVLSGFYHTVIWLSSAYSHYFIAHHLKVVRLVI